MVLSKGLLRENEVIFLTRKMLRLPALLLAALLLLPGPAALAAEGSQAAPIAAIYTTSNMYGKVSEKDPLTGVQEAASYSKVSTAMAQQRTQVADSLLLDAGNSTCTGLTGEDGQAVALALRSIGYDALVPGVEELRLGTGYFKEFLTALADPEGTGTPVTALSGNLLNGQEELLTAPYQVYTLYLGETPVRVGVLGLGAIDGARQLPERLYGDVRFSHSANQENSYVWEWNYWQSRLNQEDCDLVVVVCHAEQDELAQFAAATTGIDLLVGGDGPAKTTLFLNAEQQTVPYVCGGGSGLTRTWIVLAADGSPVVSSSALLELADYEADTALDRTLSAYTAETARKGEQQVGTLSGTWEDSFSLTRQTDTVNLVGEAMLWASGADAALVCPGALGQYSVASLFGRNQTTAPLTLADCASLAPGHSPVVTVTLTGAQLRQWLEVCAGRYTVNKEGQPAGGSTADVLYGVDYTLYLGSAAGSRVARLFFQGQPVEDSQTFTVAVSAQRLADPEFPKCEVVWSAGADREFSSQGGSTAALLAAYARNTAHQSSTLTPTCSSTWSIYPEAYNASLTRLEFVEMLYDLAGRPQPGANYAFVDVNGSSAVIWAAESRIVTGDGRGNFLPLSPVTREQAAVMLYNYVRSLDRELPQSQGLSGQLLDRPGISPWAEPAVEFCLVTGIVPTIGSRGDLFLPASSITRSEAALYLSNLQAWLT